MPSKFSNAEALKTDQQNHQRDQVVPTEPIVTLQVPNVFVEDFPKEAAEASGQVALHGMQFEVAPVVMPLFDAVSQAKHRGVPDVRFRYDRVARQHIRAGEGQAWSRAGITVHKGDKEAIKQAISNREELIQSFEAASISDPEFKKRGSMKRRSHDHIKLAIVDDVAWFGTMNFRANDFEISNFMMKVYDSQAVSVIKRIFGQIEDSSLVKDEVVQLDSHNGSKTEILVDAGNKGKSCIYDRALEMVDSLESGDGYVFISQWPPNTIMSGRPLLKRVVNKTKQNKTGCER